MLKKEFIQKIKNKFPENLNKYDYDLLPENFVSKNKIKIFCNEVDEDGVAHGWFEQLSQAHLQGQGCPKCGIIKTVKKQTLNKIRFLEKLKQKFPENFNKYDYSETIYIHSKQKIKIFCKNCGKYFEQRPDQHLFGQGCLTCKIIKTTKSINEFINKSKEIHNPRRKLLGLSEYEFDINHNTKYINSTTKINIWCNEADEDEVAHGWFEQLPSNHLQGHEGCLKCSNQGISKQEKEVVEFIKNNYMCEIEENNRSILKNNHELDIYLADHNLAIEICGLYWHNELNKPDKKYHQNKLNECLSKGIKLIQIFEDEWINKQDIVKSRLRNLLGKINNKIYARNCYVKTIYDVKVERKFLEDNHIQGYSPSKICYGLYEKSTDKLVSLMSFSLLRKNLGSSASDETLELLRFCNVINTSVVGGASKLFKHFLKNNKDIHQIISYADRRWSTGDLYDKLGFKDVTSNHQPNYFYVNGLTRENRFKYRKDVLINQHGCSIDDTEHNFMKESMKMYRIYDCGTLKFQFNRK